MILKVIKVFVVCALFSGCATASDSKGRDAGANNKLPVSYALKGTSTALVGIAIDKKGYPLETVKAVVLTPGQKVVFAGPDEFQIAFKNRKSPNNKINYKSENGVIWVRIPRDILDRPEYREEYEKNKAIEFNYAIRINGKELDPPLIIKKEE